MLKAEKQRNIFELLMRVLLLAVLSGLLSRGSFVHFHNNAHVRSLLTDFCHISNTSNYLTYLQRTASSSLFNYAWYNLDPLNQQSEQKFFRKDWLRDDINRMIGSVRLRQFRVKPGYCHSPRNLTSDCAPPFGRHIEDRRDYKQYWILHNKQAENRTEYKYFDDWSYKWPAYTSHFYYYGNTGRRYPPGGYLWNLGTSKEEIETKAINLEEEWWLGHYTRAVLAQFTIYNVNTRFFTEAVLIAERTISGDFLPTIVVHSVDVNVHLDIWFVLLMLMPFIACIRIYTAMNFEGVLGYFKNWRHPYELLFTSLTLVSLLYLLLHHLSAATYVNEYQLTVEDLKLFRFYKIANYLFTVKSLLCVLFILALLRFYSLWRFGRTQLRLFFTFLLSLKTVLWSMLIFILFTIVLFRIVGYLLSIFSDVNFNPNLFYKTNYLYFFVKNELLRFKLLCFLLCFGSVIITILFVRIFTYEYKEARKQLIVHWNVVNLITFATEEIGNFFKETRRATKFEKSLILKHGERKLNLKKRGFASN